jgi:hypothetical protein
MSTTAIIILNVFFIVGIVLAITGMLFHAIRTSPATERIHRRARSRAVSRPRRASTPIRVPATVRD